MLDTNLEDDNRINRISNLMGTMDIRKQRLIKQCQIALGEFDEDFIYEDVDFSTPSSIQKAYVLYEKQLAGLKKKADASGISYGILKKVFDRGMAAWKTGHRPGATPHQWAYARVNSFITGGKTRTTADADLWAKHKGKKESLEEAKFDVAFDGFEGEWTNLKDELKKMRIKISNHYDDDGRHEFTIDTNKAKLKQLMKKFGDLEMNESLKEVKEPFAVVCDGEVLGTYSKEPMQSKIKALARDNKVDFKKCKVVKTKKKQSVGNPLKENAKCPTATQDLEVNTTNRDATIKKFNYGPLNVDEPGSYWKDIAKYWKTTEEAARKSLCENCVAFDISPRMKDCMPGKTSDKDGELGYCWMHHFKCHSARSCHTWAKGGPITDDETSYDWQERSKI